MDHAPVFQGDRDDLVPLVYPGEVPLYVGLAEDGVLALELPEGRSRRGIQEETLVGEADEDVSGVVVARDLEREYRRICAGSFVMSPAL